LDPVVVRSISREYRIRTPSPELAALLAFFDARPELEGAPLVPVEITAEPLPEGFRLRLSNEEVAAGSALDALTRIFAAIYGAIQDEVPGAPLVHGACIVSGGARLILIGRSGAGKSTLTLRLLAGGCDVEGDEDVVVREGDLIAKPRRMHVKAGSLLFVPEFADAILNSPAGPDHLPAPTYAVDPAIAGRPWRIRPGQARHLVFLEPNHGGPSALGALDTHDAFARLMEHCLLPSPHTLAAVARLRRLACTARSWRLVLGDLVQAEGHLRHLLHEAHGSVA
jgi:hypothetical protein